MMGNANIEESTGGGIGMQRKNIDRSALLEEIEKTKIEEIRSKNNGFPSTRQPKYPPSTAATPASAHPPSGCDHSAINNPEEATKIFL